MASTVAKIQVRFRRWRDRLLPSGTAISRIAVVDMLAHNWHLGLTCFGGPTVHFQIFRELFVDKYHWIDETTYQEMFALCQALNGPASTKLLFGVNVLRYGFWVGLLAFFVWSLPMAVAAAGLGFGIATVGNSLPDPVYALLSGLNSATVGIIALAAVQLSQKAITDKLTRILVFVGGAAGMLYSALWFFPVLMLAGGCTTVIWDMRVVQRLRRKATLNPERATSAAAPAEDQSTVLEPGRGSTAVLHDPSTERQEEVQRFHAATRTHNYISSWKVATGIIAGFFSLFLIVMVCRGLYGGRALPFDLFANLLLAGTIIFGGGPVVVPLLREYIVSPGWVSSRDFLIGVAVTQSFPGPNFNIVVYLGVLALHNTSNSPILGAFLGFVAIYLPGIWLYVGFMGLWSTMRKLQVVRSGLRGMHATAVGLVFTAVYRLFRIGYLDANSQGSSLDTDPWWIVIIATAFVGGMHFGLAPPLAILLGGVMGMVWYGVTSI